MSVATGVADERLAVLDAAEASGATRADFPEAVRSNVRYADPSAWTLAACVGKLRGIAGAAADHAGLVLVTDRSPAEATKSVVERMRSGAVSPMYFLAASASSAIGVACIAHGLRGPTLNLTLPVADGAAAACRIARDWVDRGLARYMAVATLIADGERGPLARCLLVGPTVPGVPASSLVGVAAAAQTLSAPRIEPRQARAP